MEAILVAERRSTEPLTTVKLPRDLRDRLREAARSNRVEMMSLTEMFIAKGLDRIEREGLHLSRAS